MNFQDVQVLKDLNRTKDYYLTAIWEAFTVMKDMDDLCDSLVVLCDTKREQ